MCQFTSHTFQCLSLVLRLKPFYHYVAILKSSSTSFWKQLLQQVLFNVTPAGGNSALAECELRGRFILMSFSGSFLGQQGRVWDGVKLKLR